METLIWASRPDTYPWISLLVGLAVGSFLNVVIHRLPKMMQRDWEMQCTELRGESTATTGQEPVLGLVKPRSHCPNCGHKISAVENIPLLSYAFLRGRCRGCKTHISLRYPIIELVSGVGAAYCALRFGPTLASVGAMVFVWVVLAASAIDFDTQYLPDSMTLPLLWLGLIINLNGTFVELRSAVVGAAAGYLSLWIVYWAFKIATGKEGMGYGDFKLLAAIGAWMGWMMLPIVILLSSIVGSIVGIGLIAFARHGRDVPIPFGPYLGAAGVIALFWGTHLNTLIWSRIY